MRIVAGRWRGRRINAPRGRDTRPTSDRVREAIFSAVFTAIGDLEGIRVADLYAGSGALGFEALSRGAGGCVFVDSDAAAVTTIAANASALGAEAGSVQVRQEPVGRFAARAPKGAAVSLLLADPPYRIDAAEFSRVLEALAARGFVELGALVVYEHAAGTQACWPAAFAAGSVRRYGDTAVSFATYEG